ncbi:MAG: hypothetical protein OXR67_01740 [Chloroflexota bacterium]|nr:hypothetical protein [Chloroflexota bacterium]
MTLYHGTAIADWTPHAGAWVTDCHRLARAHAIANALLDDQPHGYIVRLRLTRPLGRRHLRRTSITAAYCAGGACPRGDCGQCGHSQYEVRTDWAARILQVKAQRRIAA